VASPGLCWAVPGFAGPQTRFCSRQLDRNVPQGARTCPGRKPLCRPCCERPQTRTQIRSHCKSTSLLRRSDSRMEKAGGEIHDASMPTHACHAQGDGCGPFEAKGIELIAVAREVDALLAMIAGSKRRSPTLRHACRPRSGCGRTRSRKWRPQTRARCWSRCRSRTTATPKPPTTTKRARVTSRVAAAHFSRRSDLNKAPRLAGLCRTFAQWAVQGSNLRPWD
jgi:hypothetical protein